MVHGNPSEAVCNDIVFVVEGTAACGAYLGELKSNYIVPTIEYFNGGIIQEDKDCGSETFATLYTLVVYHAADRMPAFLVDVYGPFRNPHKFLQLFDKLDFSGGHAENMAALTEGMATALHCFKDLAVLRDPGLLAQKYCILICNSPPYSIGVMDVPGYQGQTLEQLATQITENNIQLSIISPRRLPTWIHLFDKAGGDSATANTKHYAKDLRHLVMLTGYSLQESVVNQPPVATVTIPPVPTSPHGSSPSQQPTIRPPAAAPAAVRPPQPQQSQPLQRPVVPFGMNMGNPTSSQNVTITNNVPPMMSQDSGPRIRGPNPRWPTPNQGQPIQVQNQMQQPQQPQQQQQQHIQTGQIAGQMRQPNQVQLQPSIQNTQQVLLQNQPQQTNVQQGVQVMNQNPIQNVVLQQQTQQPMGTNTMQPHVQLQQSIPQQGQASGQIMVNPQQQGIRPYGPQGVNQGVTVNQGQVGAIASGQIVNQQQQIMNQQQQQQALAAQRQQQAQLLAQQQQQQQLQQAQQTQQQQPQTQPVQQQQNMNFPNSNVNIGMANQQIPTAVVAPQQVLQQQPQPGQQQPIASGAPANPARERQYIWQGMLEWQEKTRDPQKMARHVPCQVSAAVVNGDTEVKADHWPQKLLMQLIPKSLISNFGGAHFRNARSVMFHPQECEALEALAKVMSTGYAGCVHFTGMVNPLACEIKVLMLLYSPDKKAYIGFIPNDQAGFVDRIRKVIQQQKNKQGQPPGQPGPSPNQIAQQQPGANILVTQTNPLAMGGGQLTATSQPQQQPQMIQQAQQSTPMAAPTMAGPPVRGVAQTPAQLEAERQQNLMTIKKLQETLEAAQQKEVQLKAMEQQQRRAQIQMQQQMQMQHQIQPQQQQMQQAQQQQAQPQQLQTMQQPGAGMMGGQVMNSGVGGVNIQQQQMTQQMQLQQQQQQMAQQMQQQQRNIRPSAMQSNNPGNNPGLRNLLQQQQYRPPMMQQPNTQNRMQQPNVNMQQQQQQQQNQSGSQFDNLSLADLLP